MKTNTILDEIVAHKQQEVNLAKQEVSLSQLQARLPGDKTRGFLDALLRHKPSVIAEIKKASPSKGVIRAHFEPESIAKSYEVHGAACLSVLTDEHFFQGSTQALIGARSTTALPVLRKDFIVDPYQIYQTREMGADCLLLIVAILESTQLVDYHDLATELGLDVLVEVHNESELEIALQASPKLIGINNRDLRTFETNLAVTARLAKQIPESIHVVSESGINTPSDVESILREQVSSFLVGEAFMREKDPGEALEKLFGKTHSKVVGVK